VLCCTRLLLDGEWGDPDWRSVCCPPSHPVNGCRAGSCTPTSWRASTGCTTSGPLVTTSYWQMRCADLEGHGYHDCCPAACGCEHCHVQTAASVKPPPKLWLCLACMSMQMGLGKTVQTIAFLAALHNEAYVPRPSLIVVPLSTLKVGVRSSVCLPLPLLCPLATAQMCSSVMHAMACQMPPHPSLAACCWHDVCHPTYIQNWEREFATWAPYLNVVILSGNAEARKVGGPGAGLLLPFLSIIMRCTCCSAVMAAPRQASYQCVAGRCLPHSHCCSAAATDYPGVRAVCGAPPGSSQAQGGPAHP
jgi:hypothetical protein